MTIQMPASSVDIFPDTAPLATLRDYIALLKPRVMVLVVFTGIAGMVAALYGADAAATIHPLVACVAVAALAVGAGAAGAVNMWYDRDIDAIMTRTRTRPIPAGRVAPDRALEFALVLMVLSVLVMGVMVNWTAAGLLAFAQWFYAHFYTMILKRRTPQNIVIGGAAGAFPPLVGWAAVTGTLALEPVWYFLVIFLWTPPHFWALALYNNSDYTRANVPMMPVTHGVAYTRTQMVIYAVLTWGVSLLPFLWGDAGMTYALGAGLLGGLFTLSAVQVWRLKTNRSAQLLFAYSILYLFMLFALVMLDRVL